MELTDEQVASMSADQFLAHHGLSRDEPFADTGMTVDDFLMHYGVMGMHWGIRKGKGTTGVSRARGAKIDMNKRLINRVQVAQSGRKYRASMALGRAFLGAEQQRANQNRTISNLRAQNRRLQSGKVTVTDRLDVFMTTSIADLYISRTPNKSSGHWN